ncbi:MAG: HAMP domain-containing histidine kinase, partial [Caulobacterales bacterium]|nr:HAMP domain-containing histidine kinase [Caulobacterales bacterium]
GEHLLTIVNDILDFSKLQSRTLRIDEDCVCIYEQAKACCDMMRAQAQKKGVVLELRATPDLHDVISDAVRVRQIALNIISNAIKFTARGGRVQVTVATVGKKAIALQVKDTGVGMTRAELEVAMTPFGQVQNVFSRSEGGSGIGLPLVAALSDLLNSKFAIDSAPGVGTSVTIVFRDLLKASDAPEAAGACPISGEVQAKEPRS